MNAIRRPIDQRSLVDRINTYFLLDRKTSEIFDEEGGRPITTTLEARGIADESLRNFGINVPREFKEGQPFNIQDYDTNPGWTIYWLLEKAVTRMRIGSSGGNYEGHLPGRSLHYELTVQLISGLFNGEGIADKRVLEAGSGSGLTLHKLAKRGAIPTGLDSSIGALDFASYLGDHFGTGDRVNLVQGDYHEMPFRLDTFDVVLTSGVDEHEQNLVGLLRERARVTKQGGYVVVSMPNESSPFYKGFKDKEKYTKEKHPALIEIPVENIRYEHDIKNAMKEAGLRVVKEDGVLVAPSRPIKIGDIREDDLELFDNSLQNPRRQIPPFLKVNTWKDLEQNATVGQKLHYGWSRVYVAQKRAA